MTEQTVDFLTGRRSILHLNSKNEKIAVCHCLVSSFSRANSRFSRAGKKFSGFSVGMSAEMTMWSTCGCDSEAFCTVCIELSDGEQVHSTH